MVANEDTEYRRFVAFALVIIGGVARNGIVCGALSGPGTLSEA